MHNYLELLENLEGRGTRGQFQERNLKDYQLSPQIRYSCIMKYFLMILLFALICSVPPVVAETQTSTYLCQPTAEDEMGPFYRPGAPLRSRIGSGYLLTGTVKSAADCQPISAPLIEFWQAGPKGRYSDAYRAAIITDDSGQYQLETDFPAAYLTRPPHIHIRVSAPGYQTLVTQHYLEPATRGAVFDLILAPNPRNSE